MGEIDYGALFGIDATGAEAQEVAEPAAQTSNQAQGVEAPELAEPDEQPTENDAAPAEPAEEEATQETDGAGAAASASDTDEGQEQTEAARDIAFSSKKERDAQFAAARRKAEAERDAAVEKAKADAQAEAQRIIDEAFKQSGMMNPYTEQPITTKEEYDAYRQRYDAEKKKALLRKSGMTDAEFDAFVQNLPEVRRAKQAQEQAEKAQREAHFAAARVKVEEQLKEISALDPSIKELSDLAKMPAYPRFYELVKKGNSLTDAFKLANYDALTKGAMQGARQSALNAAQGKMHMEQTRSRGTPVSAVPPDVRDMYRALNPDATDSEIQAHYQRYHKN